MQIGEPYQARRPEWPQSHGSGESGSYFLTPPREEAVCQLGLTYLRFDLRIYLFAALACANRAYIGPRANTNFNDTEANAAGRSGNACALCKLSKSKFEFVSKSI